jgi:hypothetical protein
VEYPKLEEELSYKKCYESVYVREYLDNVKGTRLQVIMALYSPLKSVPTG